MNNEEKIKCPYCDSENLFESQDVTYDGDITEQECVKCKKIFEVTARVKFEYEVSELEDEDDND